MVKISRLPCGFSGTAGFFFFIQPPVDLTLFGLHRAMRVRHDRFSCVHSTSHESDALWDDTVPLPLLLYVCCTRVGRNVCHGSDSTESAEHEIKLWFPE